MCGCGAENESEISSSYFSDLRDVDWVEGPIKLPNTHASDHHIACILNAESKRVIGRLVREELRDGKQYLHIRLEGSTPEPRSIRAVDINAIVADVDADRYHVETLSSDQTTPRDLIVSLEEMIAERSEDGTATVVTVDVASFAAQLSDAELLGFQMRLNDTCRSSETAVLSLHDRSRMQAATISDLLQAYPYVVTGGVICCNPQYIPTEQFFTEERAAYRLDRTLETLDEQRRAHGELTKLEQQNNQLKVFANSIAHDLRNPLQTAIGRAEMLPGEDDQAQVVQKALDRMETLIHDGLQMVHEEDLSDSEDISMSTLVHQCWNVIDVGDADLTVAEEFAVTGDRSRLRQLFENLFRNSLEHAGSSPSIEIGPVEKIHFATRPDEDEGYAGFYVEDDGPGIPQEKRSEVFDFGETDGDGTGYGLAIVNQIVEAHDWSIHISASGDGGARFEITGVDAYPEN